MARKGDHVQSARQIMRNKQKLINSTQQSLGDLTKFSKKWVKFYCLLILHGVWEKTS